jgi:hypothetical protein
MAITFNDNIIVSAGKALDYKYGPFDTTIIALDTVKILQRYRGLTIGIGDTTVVEYWFKDGIEDSDFVQKTATGNLTGITEGNGILVSGITTNPTVAIDTDVVQTVSNLSTNIITDASNAAKYPNVPAVKTYVDSFLVSVINDRGNFIPSSSSPGLYPSSGGSGTPPGTIVKGDLWFINFNPGQTTGYLGTSPVQIGTSVRALVNSPSPTTPTDWDILDAGLGYIPEDSANRVLDGTGITSAPNSSTNYPSVKALTEFLTNFTPSVPTLQEVVSSEVGAGTVAGYDIVVQDTSTPTQTVTINSNKITLVNTTNTRTIDVGSNDKIKVQVGSDYTTYESDRITFNKSSSFTTTLLAKDSNQTVYLPSPVENNKVLAVSVNGTYANDNGNIVYNFLPSVSASRVPRMNASGTVLEDSRIYDDLAYGVKFFTTNNRSMTSASVQIGDAGGTTNFLTETVAIESGVSHVGIYSVPGVSSSSAVSSLSLGRSSSSIGVSANSFTQTATINSNPTNPLDDNLAFSYNIRNQTNGTPVETSFPLTIYADGRASIQGGAGDIPNNSGLAINANAFALSGGLALYVNGPSLFDGEVRVGSGQQLIVESLGSTQANLVIANADGSLSTTGIPSGTINKIPKWTATGSLSLGDSQIFDNGTNVGIGTVSPSEKLHVNGNIFIGETGAPDNDSYAIKLQGKGTTGTNQTGEIKIDASGTAATQGCLQLSTSGFMRFSSGSAEGYAFTGSPAILRNNSGGMTLQAFSASQGIVLRNNTNQTSGKLLSVVNAGNNEPLTILASTGTEANVGINIATPARSLHINDVMRLQPRSSDPSSGSAGDIYYNSVANKLKIHNGTTWKTVQFEP